MRPSGRRDPPTLCAVTTARPESGIASFGFRLVMPPSHSAETLKSALAGHP
jgi:hypothetical protein